MWNDLTQAEKATIIKLGVKAGYTSVEDIQKAYDEHNSFSDGGSFEEWREQLVDVKPHMAEDIYSEDPTYDYLKYFEENPEDAWNMLVMDSKAHFTDKYKLPNHPTFSDQSIYSTPETPGGTWHENYGGSGRWVFEHSPYTIKHKEATHRYLEGSGEGYLDGMNTVFPQETIRTNKHGFGDWLHSIFSDEETEAVELTPFTFNNTTMYRNDNDNTYYADDKGKVPVKDTDNDLLYAYYNSNIKGMSNEDIINFYTKRFRALQDKWMAASKPLEYNTRSPKIKVTKGKSSDVLVPTAMIDSIVSHMKDHKYTVNKKAGLVDDPYTALAVASVETDFGKHLNHGSLVDKSGLTPAVFNDERYYLPDQSYYAGLSTALRNYYNELSKTQEMEEKQENFVKRYLVLKNLFKDPKAVEYVGNALKKDLVYKRFKNYTMQDLLPPPNVYDHILERIFSGKYNSGRPDYNSIVRENAKTLRRDPNVKRYVQKAVKKYDIGGPTDDKIITTGNEIGDVALSFAPFVGTAMDIEEAMKNPTFGNISIAAGGLVLDAFGLSLIKGAFKTARAATKAAKAVDKLSTSKKTYEKALKNAEKYGNTPKRRTRVRDTWDDYKTAEKEFKSTHKSTNRRGVDRKRKHRYEAPTDWSPIINPATVYGTEGILNASQYYTK